MASRRFRIKPVANVPIRRGKANLENERSDATTNSIQPPLVEIKSETSVCEGGPSTSSNNCEENENVPYSDTASVTNAKESSVTVVTSATVNSTTTEGDSKSEKSSSLNTKGDDHSKSSGNENIGSSLIKKPASNNNGIPPGLARKRMKPAVSISAVNRRPRELNKSLNDKLPNSTPTQVDTQDHDRRNSNEYEKSGIVSPHFQKGDKDTPFNSIKDIGAGVPGITPIPTGTAIRPQHDRITGSSTPVVGKGDAPLCLPEPDLPSEGAGGGDIALLKPSSSQGSIPLRSRFIRPTPRIDINSRNRRPSLSSTHSVESDNESRKASIASPGNRELPPVKVPSVTTENKNASCASASESDDESRRSEATTITPPNKRLTETPRARFVKPTPRFMEASARRNSIQGSASESEDESKRTFSQALTITPPNKRQADFNSEDSIEISRDDSLDEPEKKIRNRRAPSTCMVRMAKARQEFQSKFGKKTPDRSRLTMFDLIFYNPTTNPMKSTQQNNEKVIKPITLDNEEEQIIEERLDEEKVDEPSAQGDKEQDEDNFEDEEEMAMPVPQVKVGPDGQIILDEQSLVIETTGVKKGREDLANSEVIIDTGTTGHGFYSRKNKKSKEWSKRETLKFYKALNVVGTDFLLMQTIFPKRTRLDLKTKFKKEDRLNRYLVEKALCNPVDFDLTELEKDLEKEEEEERQNNLKKLIPKSSQKRKKKYHQSNKKSFLVKCMNDGDTGNVPDRKNSKRKVKNEPEEVTPAKRSRKFSGAMNGSSSEEENELEFNYQDDLKFSTGIGLCDENSKTEPGDASDDEADVAAEMEYLTKPRKPTRSGRIPQPRKLLEIEGGKELEGRPEEEQEQEGENVEETENRERESNVLVGSKNDVRKITHQPRPLEDLTNVEPGSLVVVATESDDNPGHHVYKVFMVTPSQADALAPVNVPLPPNLLHSVSDGIVNNHNEMNETESSIQTENFSGQSADPVHHAQLTATIPVQQESELVSIDDEFAPAQIEQVHMSEFIPLQGVNPSAGQLNKIPGSEQSVCLSTPEESHSDLQNDPLSLEQHTETHQLTEMKPLVIDI